MAVQQRCGGAGLLSTSGSCVCWLGKEDENERSEASISTWVRSTNDAGKVD